MPEAGALRWQRGEGTTSGAARAAVFFPWESRAACRYPDRWAHLRAGLQARTGRGSTAAERQGTGGRGGRRPGAGEAPRPAPPTVAVAGGPRRERSPPRAAKARGKGRLCSRLRPHRHRGSGGERSPPGRPRGGRSTWAEGAASVPRRQFAAPARGGEERSGAAPLRHGRGVKLAAAAIGCGTGNAGRGGAGQGARLGSARRGRGCGASRGGGGGARGSRAGGAGGSGGRGAERTGPGSGAAAARSRRRTLPSRGLTGR